MIPTQERPRFNHAGMDTILSTRHRCGGHGPESDGALAWVGHSPMTTQRPLADRMRPKSPDEILGKPGG